MNLNQFTEKSQSAISDAQDIAIRFGHQQVDVDHLVLALVDQEHGLVRRILERVGVDPSRFGSALTLKYLEFSGSFLLLLHVFVLWPIEEVGILMLKMTGVKVRSGGSCRGVEGSEFSFS